MQVGPLNQNTYPPGTILTVGSNRIKIVKYLTSGGYAQIYSCQILGTRDDSLTMACLKRVHVPNKQSLSTLRAEVDAMKLLSGNPHIVSYIDSHASKSTMNNGTYEVFVLMEYCAKGGLIDFMNARLQTRLSEYEVLNIMNQVTQGILEMHRLQPPLIHRDIKIENVLISEDGSFKVCDFGSVSGIIRPPKNSQELNYVLEDLMKNTTVQYMSPEMMDLFRGLPIDEKSDIWALGVFLYKLCYYTTPFENRGKAAILQASFSFPSYPPYSNQLKNLISVMLIGNPANRPNICQVLEEVCRIQGIKCPIRNFYLDRMAQQQQTQLRHSLSQPLISVVSTEHSLAPPVGQLQNLQIGNTTLLKQASTPYVDVTNGTSAVKAFQTLADDLVHNVKNPSDPVPHSMVRSKTLNIPSGGHINLNDTDIVGSGRGDINKIIAANPVNLKRTIYADAQVQTFNKQKYESTSLSPSLEGSKRDSKSVAHLNEQPKVFRGQRNSMVVTSSSVPTVQLRGQSRTGDHTNQQISPGSSSSSSSNQNNSTSPMDRNLLLKGDLLSITLDASPEGCSSVQERLHKLLEDSNQSGSKGNAISQKPAASSSNIPPKKIPPKKPCKPDHLRPTPPPKPAHLRSSGIRKNITKNTNTDKPIQC